MESLLQAQDVLSDPLLPSVARQGQARQMLALPWMPKRVRLGTCFRSDLSHTSTPFSGTPLFTSACTDTYRPSGGTASFRSSDSSTATASSEHLSTTLGISAGCPFLRASVTGQYDRAALSNADAGKTSISTSYRCGTVALATPPCLTEAALLILKHGGGLPALKQACGDYYVAAYVHGASASQSVAVTVKLRLLFWTAGRTDAKAWGAASSAADVSVSAFSTLGQVRVSETVAGGGQELRRLAAKARDVVAGVDAVPGRVEAALDKLGVRAGEAVGGEACDGLCDEGLVVELVLMPIETLREVQLWATSTDVI